MSMATLTETLQRLLKFFQSAYLLIAKDLTNDEFERLFSRDTRGMYEFYVRGMKSVEGEKNRFLRWLKFAWNLFVAFLKKLTPVRRLLFLLALAIFVNVNMADTSLAFVYSFVIMTFLLALEVSDKLTTKNELEIAREIQLDLQPQGFPGQTGFEAAAHSEVANTVGGDYYDFIGIPPAASYVVVGDVSGKGISAALYTVKVQTAIRLFLQETNKLKDVLVRLDGHLHGQLKRNYFLTVALLKLHRSGIVEVARAGHPPVLWWKAKDRSVTWVRPEGAAIGMGWGSEGRLRTTFKVERLKTAPGDVIVAFSDGVLENADVRGNEYGTERLESVVKAFGHESASLIAQTLAGELARFRRGAILRDDITFVVLKRLDARSKPGNALVDRSTAQV